MDHEHPLQSSFDRDSFTLMHGLLHAIQDLGVCLGPLSVELPRYVFAELHVGEIAVPHRDVVEGEETVGRGVAA